MESLKINQNRIETSTRSFLVLSVIIVLFLTAGCGVRNANVEPGEAVSVAQFSGKKIAVLPVYGDESVGTDSQLQLKKNINIKLSKKLSGYLPETKIVGAKKTIPVLNKNNKLKVFGDLVAPYKSVGVFDSQVVESLFKLLQSDYLVISTLDNENIDVVAVNAYFISLDVIIVDRNNEIVWSGTGDFKQGGMFGAGRVNSSQGAQEVVDLAFAYWAGEIIPEGTSQKTSTQKPKCTTDQILKMKEMGMTSDQINNACN